MFYKIRINHKSFNDYLKRENEYTYSYSNLHTEIHKLQDNCSQHTTFCPCSFAQNTEVF